MVQDTPGLDFARDFLLEGIHRRVLLPAYKSFCKQPVSDPYYYRIRLECLVTFLFGVVNTPCEVTQDSVGSSQTSLIGLNRRGRQITHESLIGEGSDTLYPTGNLSYKTFLRVASQAPQIVVDLVNWILIERKVLIVSPSTSLHHMRRNAIFIESLFSLLTPFLQALPLIYLNIAYLSSADQVLEFMDSPVPYILGMNVEVWDSAAQFKWSRVSQEDYIAVLKLDGDTPQLLFPSVANNEGGFLGPSEVIQEHLRSSLDFISSRLLKESSARLSEKETKLYLKQAFYNYLILAVPEYRESFRHHDCPRVQEFYSLLSQTQLYNEFLLSDQNQSLRRSWEILNREGFARLLEVQRCQILEFQKTSNELNLKIKLKELDHIYNKTVGKSKEDPVSIFQGAFNFNPEIILSPSGAVNQLYQTFHKSLLDRVKPAKAPFVLPLAPQPQLKQASPQLSKEGEGETPHFSAALDKDLPSQLIHTVRDSEVPNERSIVKLAEPDDAEDFDCPKVKVIEDDCAEDMVNLHHDYGPGSQKSCHNFVSGKDGGGLKMLDFVEAVQSANQSLRRTVCVQDPNEIKILARSIQKETVKTPQPYQKQAHKEEGNNNETSLKHFFIATFQKLTNKFAPNHNTDEESTVKDAFNHYSGFQEASNKEQQHQIYRFEEDSYFLQGKAHGLISEMIEKKEDQEKAQQAITAQSKTPPPDQPKIIESNVFGPKQGATFFGKVQTYVPPHTQASKNQQLSRSSLNQLLFSQNKPRSIHELTPQHLDCEAHEQPFLSAAPANSINPNYLKNGRNTLLNSHGTFTPYSREHEAREEQHVQPFIIDDIEKRASIGGVASLKSNHTVKRLNVNLENESCEIETVELSQKSPFNVQGCRISSAQTVKGSTGLQGIMRQSIEASQTPGSFNKTPGASIYSPKYQNKPFFTRASNPLKKGAPSSNPQAKPTISARQYPQASKDLLHRHPTTQSIAPACGLTPSQLPVKVISSKQTYKPSLVSNNPPLKQTLSTKTGALKLSENLSGVSVPQSLKKTPNTTRKSQDPATAQSALSQPQIIKSQSRAPVIIEGRVVNAVELIITQGAADQQRLRSISHQQNSGPDALLALDAMRAMAIKNHMGDVQSSQNRNHSSSSSFSGSQPKLKSSNERMNTSQSGDYLIKPKGSDHTSPLRIDLQTPDPKVFTFEPKRQSIDHNRPYPQVEGSYQSIKSPMGSNSHRMQISQHRGDEESRSNSQTNENNAAVPTETLTWDTQGNSPEWKRKNVPLPSQGLLRMMRIYGDHGHGAQTSEDNKQVEAPHGDQMPSSFAFSQGGLTQPIQTDFSGAASQSQATRQGDRFLFK